MAVNFAEKTNSRTDRLHEPFLVRYLRHKSLELSPETGHAESVSPADVFEKDYFLILVSNGDFGRSTSVRHGHRADLQAGMWRGSDDGRWIYLARADRADGVDEAGRAGTRLPHSGSSSGSGGRFWLAYSQYNRAYMAKMVSRDREVNHGD